jgi:hypothetical protein
MKTITISTLFLFFLGSASAQSGILKSVGGLAKEKGKTEAGDFNSSRSNREKGNINDDKNNTTTADSTVTPSKVSTVEKSYTFDINIVYEMQDLKKKKEEKNVMNSFYSENAMMNIVDENNSSIFDVKNKVMIMIDEKGKSAMAMSSEMMMRGMDKTVQEETSKYTMTMTGNEKVIMTYNCEEVISTNTETGEKTVMWITKEIKNEFAVKFGNQMMGGSKSVSKMPKSDMEGVMMEMTSYDKKGEAEFHMIMTKFELAKTVKDLSTYRITKL